LAFAAGILGVTLGSPAFEAVAMGNNLVALNASARKCKMYHHQVSKKARVQELKAIILAVNTRRVALQTFINIV